MAHRDRRVVADPPARLVQPPDQVDVLAVAQRRVEDRRRSGTVDAAQRGGPAARRSGRRRPGVPGCDPGRRADPRSRALRAPRCTGRPQAARRAAARCAARPRPPAGSARCAASRSIQPGVGTQSLSRNATNSLVDLGQAGVAGRARARRCVRPRAAARRARRATSRDRGRVGRAVVDDDHRCPWPSAARQRSRRSARSRTGMSDGDVGRSRRARAGEGGPGPRRSAGGPGRRRPASATGPACSSGQRAAPRPSDSRSTRGRRSAEQRGCVELLGCRDRAPTRKPTGQAAAVGSSQRQPAVDRHDRAGHRAARRRRPGRRARRRPRPGRAVAASAAGGAKSVAPSRP